MSQGEAGYGWPPDVTIDAVELRCTCGSHPEQYDAFLADRQVGYLRLRHGEFTVRCPDVGGELVYCSWPNGDGQFEPEERTAQLELAVAAIHARLTRKTER